MSHSSQKTGVFRRDFNIDYPKIVKGEGVYLEDNRGNRYLDAVASAGVVGVGHGRTEILKALYDAGKSVSFVYNGVFTHPWQEQLAESLLSIAFPNMSKVYFVSGGSEANESALKLARQYFVEKGLPQKYKAIARWQSYHGVTLATLSLSGRTSWRQIYSPYLISVTHIMPPYHYRCPFCSNTASCTLECANELEKAILLEGPDTVAVFFAEPVVGTTATGLAPPSEYYQKIREICDRHEVLFVADEVLSGYGRCGYPLALQYTSIEPDIVTVGKAIGSGYSPLGATLVSDKIVDTIRSKSGRFIHGFTYSGTPVSCLVGLKVFEIMQDENLFNRAQHMGSYLRRKLLELASRHETIGDVRGLGLLVGIEFVADRTTRQPFPIERRFAWEISRAMRQRGIIITTGLPGINFGKNGDHIQISPPLIISETEIDKIVSALDDSLIEVSNQAS